jgi:hypothetical protein
MLAPCVGGWGFLLGGAEGAAIALGGFAVFVALGTWRVKRRAASAAQATELAGPASEVTPPESTESAPGRLH